MKSTGETRKRTYSNIYILCLSFYEIWWSFVWNQFRLFIRLLIFQRHKFMIFLLNRFTWTDNVEIGNQKIYCKKVSASAETDYPDWDDDKKESTAKEQNKRIQQIFKCLSCDNLWTHTACARCMNWCQRPQIDK